MKPEFEVNILPESGVRFKPYRSDEESPRDYIGMSKVQPFGKSYKFRITLRVNYIRLEDKILIDSIAHFFIQSDLKLFSPESEDKTVCVIADCLFLMSGMIHETAQAKMPLVRKKIYQTSEDAIPHARAVYASGVQNN